MNTTDQCCDLHRPKGCCDPYDCGPCCPNCPTCPSVPEAERAEQVTRTEADYRALECECALYRLWWLDATERAAKADQDRHRAEIRAAAWCAAAKKLARQARGGAA